MASERQTEANRENAKKSTGPKTSGGKEVAARNSFQHGMYSQAVVIEGESLEEFEALRAGLLDDWKPTGATERALVEGIAISQWKLIRLERAEANYMHQAMKDIASHDYVYSQKPTGHPVDTATQQGISANGKLETFHRFQQRLESAIARSIRMLEKLRRMEKAGLKAPVEETKNENEGTKPILSEASEQSAIVESIECPRIAIGKRYDENEIAPTTTTIDSPWPNPK